MPRPRAVSITAGSPTSSATRTVAALSDRSSARRTVPPELVESARDGRLGKSLEREVKGRMDTSAAVAVDDADAEALLDFLPDVVSEIRGRLPGHRHGSDPNGLAAPRLEVGRADP